MAMSGAPSSLMRGSSRKTSADRDEAARVDLTGGFDTLIGYVVDGLAAVFASLQGGLLLAKTYKDPQYLRDALDASYAHLLSFAPPGPS